MMDCSTNLIEFMRSKFIWRRNLVLFLERFKNFDFMPFICYYFLVCLMCLSFVIRQTDIGLG